MKPFLREAIKIENPVESGNHPERGGGHFQKKDKTGNNIFPDFDGGKNFRLSLLDLEFCLKGGLK